MEDKNRNRHPCKTLRIGPGDFGSFCGAGSEEVAGDEGEVLDELAGLGIGDEELGEGSEMFYGLLSIALGVLLRREVGAVADTGLGLVLGGLPEAFIRGVPDELLENLVGVFVVDLLAGLEGQAVRGESEMRARARARLTT